MTSIDFAQSNPNILAIVGVVGSNDGAYHQRRRHVDRIRRPTQRRQRRHDSHQRQWLDDALGAFRRKAVLFHE